MSLLIGLDMLLGTVSILFLSCFIIYIFVCFKSEIFIRSSNKGDSFFSLDLLVSEKVFFFVVFSNVSGLSGSWEPYAVWPSVVLSLSFLCWVSVVLRWISGNWKSLFSHLTPMGISFFGSLFMAMIEIVSFIIRFLTLGLRLSANILGGHLVFDLLDFFEIGVSGYVLLILYECFVSICQGLIFSLLLMNYLEEAGASL